MHVCNRYPVIQRDGALTLMKLVAQCPISVCTKDLKQSRAYTVVLYIVTVDARHPKGQNYQINIAIIIVVHCTRYKDQDASSDGRREEDPG